MLNLVTGESWCDECDNALGEYICQCDETIMCETCRDNQETCVICEEKTCYNCEVLTESGHMHESCRDLEPEDKEIDE